MSNAYEVSKRVFEEYFINRDSMTYASTTSTSGNRKIYQGSYTERSDRSSEFERVYLDGHYYRMAKYLMFLSVFENEARIQTTDPGGNNEEYADIALDAIIQGIGAVFNNTYDGVLSASGDRGGIYVGFWENNVGSDWSYATTSASAIAAATSFLKHYNYSRIQERANLTSRRIDRLHTDTFRSMDQGYRSTRTNSRLPRNTFQGTVQMGRNAIESQAGFGGYLNAPMSLNVFGWYSFALAMDSYLNHNGNANDYNESNGRSRGRLAEIANFIRFASYEVDRAGMQGQLHTVGGGRDYFNLGYMTWTGGHLGMIAYGTNHSPQFNEDINSVYQTENRNLIDGLKTIIQRYGAMPNVLHPNSNLMAQNYRSDVSSGTSGIDTQGNGTPNDFLGYISLMNSSDYQGNQPFQEWWDNQVRQRYSINTPTAIEYMAGVDYKDFSSLDQPNTEPNHLRSLVTLTYGMMRQITFS